MVAAATRTSAAPIIHWLAISRRRNLIAQILMASSGFDPGSAYPCSVCLSYVMSSASAGGDMDGSGLVWLVSIIAGAIACLPCGLQSVSGCGIGSTAYLVTTTTFFVRLYNSPCWTQTPARTRFKPDGTLGVFHLRHGCLYARCPWSRWVPFMQQHVGCRCVLRDEHVVATGFVASPILAVMAAIAFAIDLPVGSLFLPQQRLVWR